jgi:hypothetical protein
MNPVRLAFAAVVLAGVGPAWAAQDPCAQFKWDVTREVALFRTSPVPIAAAAAPLDAPSIQPDMLYRVQLHPQEAVTLAAPVSKKMLDDGAFGGLLRIRLPESGTYRISVDAGFWIDVADASGTLQRADFSGSQNCTTPRKVVLYELAGGKDFHVQLTGSSLPHALLVLVRVPSSMP